MDRPLLNYSQRRLGLEDGLQGGLQGGHQVGQGQRVL